METVDLIYDTVRRIEDQLESYEARLDILERDSALLKQRLSWRGILYASLPGIAAIGFVLWK